MKKFNLTLLFLGLVFLAYLLWRVGLGELGRQVREVGWGVLLLISTEGVANFIHTIGWRHCITKGPAPLPLLRLFRMAMAGFAINYLLPAASVGGEASKAALLASSRPAHEAFSSVLLDKLATALAHLLLAIFGAGFVLWYGDLPSELWIPMLVTTLLLAGGMLAFLLIQRHGKLGALLRWLTHRRLGGELARQASRHISEVDEALKRFYRERPLDLAASIGWHLLGHSTALLQAWLFLWFLNQPSPLPKVACAGLLSLWFDLLTFAIPLNLGALEGSRIVALKAIGNNASAGLAFGVSIRITQLFWACYDIISYGFFTVRQNRAKRPNSATSLPEQTDATPLH